MSIEKLNGPKMESNNSTNAQTNTMENGQDDNKVHVISKNIEHDSEESAANCNIVLNAKDGKAKSTNPEISVNTQKVQYALNAVVCYVDDKNNEERRNIVALLQVGPNYHERLSGSAVSQWYIFNDFW